MSPMATSIVMRAPVRPIPALQHGKRKKKLDTIFLNNIAMAIL